MDIDKIYIITSKEVVNRLYNNYDSNYNSNYNSNIRTSLGVIEFGNTGFKNSDLLYSQYENAVINNTVSQKHIIGNNNNIDRDTESSLDIQVIYYGDSLAELWYFQNNGWIYSWANTFRHINNVPDVVSISYEVLEVKQCNADPYCSQFNLTYQQYIDVVENELMIIALSGRTVLVSSGDYGSPDPINEYCESTLKDYGYTNITLDFNGWSYIYIKQYNIL